MELLFTTVLAAALVNNFVLVQFLGLCPFMGASRQVEGALGLSLATGFVLTLSAALSHIIQGWILEPLSLEYLRLTSFMLVIGGAVQATELMVRRMNATLHAVLGIYMPLIASNCAVLGVALLNTDSSRSLFQAICYGAGAALGFGLVLTTFGALRARLETNAIPRPFKGNAIALITAGIMSLAFLGFTGLVRT